MTLMTIWQLFKFGVQQRPGPGRYGGYGRSLRLMLEGMVGIFVVMVLIFLVIFM